MIKAEINVERIFEAEKTGKTSELTGTERSMLYAGRRYGDIVLLHMLQNGNQGITSNGGVEKVHIGNIEISAIVFGKVMRYLKIHDWVETGSRVTGDPSNPEALPRIQYKLTDAGKSHAEQLQAEALKSKTGTSPQEPDDLLRKAAEKELEELAQTVLPDKIKFLKEYFLRQPK